jgi:hypothetical protein
MMPEAAPFPSPKLPQDVAARLIAEWDSAYDELSALLKTALLQKSKKRAFWASLNRGFPPIVLGNFR